MDFIPTPYISIGSRLLYMFAALFAVGGFIMILKALFTLKTSSSMEDTKEVLLFNIKVGGVAIVISVIAISYLKSFLTVTVDYI